MKRGVVFLAALLLTPPQAEAAPALSPLFTDRMVLQRDQQVPVWGTAATNEIITVTFTDQSKTVGVDTNGRWRVRLDPMPASREPRELSVTSSRGREEIVLRDVLVGDVWLAGGQSNMGSRMKEYLPTVAPEIPQANYPLFRVFTVPQRKVLSESMPSAAWRCGRQVLGWGMSARSQCSMDLPGLGRWRRVGPSRSCGSGAAAWRTCSAHLAGVISGRLPQPPIWCFGRMLTARNSTKWYWMNLAAAATRPNPRSRP